MNAVGLALACVVWLAPVSIQADALGREWELRVQPPSVTPGQKDATVSLTIVPIAGRHIPSFAPLSVEVTAPENAKLKLLRRRYSRADAADPRAEAPRFDVKVQGEPGTYQLKLTAKFWTCGRMLCRPAQDTAVVELVWPTPE